MCSPPVTSMGTLKPFMKRTASAWPAMLRLKLPSRSAARESAPADTLGVLIYLFIALKGFECSQFKFHSIEGIESLKGTLPAHESGPDTDPQTRSAEQTLQISQN